jgi:hypothetical protein
MCVCGGVAEVGIFVLVVRFVYKRFKKLKR